MNTPERISLVNAEPVLRRALQRALDDMASGQSAATFIVCARVHLDMEKQSFGRNNADLLIASSTTRQNHGYVYPPRQKPDATLYEMRS